MPGRWGASNRHVLNVCMLLLSVLNSIVVCACAQVLCGVLAEAEDEVVTTGVLEALLRALIGATANPAAHRRVWRMCGQEGPSS